MSGSAYFSDTPHLTHCPFLNWCGLSGVLPLRASRSGIGELPPRCLSVTVRGGHVVPLVAARVAHDVIAAAMTGRTEQFGALPVSAAERARTWHLEGAHS